MTDTRSKGILYPVSANTSTVHGAKRNQHIMTNLANRHCKYFFLFFVFCSSSLPNRTPMEEYKACFQQNLTVLSISRSTFSSNTQEWGKSLRDNNGRSNQHRPPNPCEPPDWYSRAKLSFRMTDFPYPTPPFCYIIFWLQMGWKTTFFRILIHRLLGLPSVWITSINKW